MFLRTSVHIFGKNMWGKASPHALKGQKLLGGAISHIQYALKGQKLLAQGIALG